MTIRRRHWMAAFGVALAVHASLVLVLWKPDDTGAQALGIGGVEISLGMAGGAPGATAVSPPQAEVVEPPEMETDAAPAELTEVATVEATEVTDVADAVPVQAVKPRTAAAQVKLKPAPPVKTPPKPTPPEKNPPKEARAVAPKPVEAARPPSETASKQPVREASTRPASIAGSAGKSGTQKSANTGSGKSTSSGGRPGSAKSYFATLQAWLERHKEYPLAARRRRSEGTAVLNFTMQRDGRVVQAKILRGTGSGVLDEEVMRMIRRAAPLPPFPDDFQQSELTLSVPVQFQLF